MRVIQSRNVNAAYAQGLELLRREGVREESRAGPVLVMPCPVTTVYERPTERVLLCPRRDANPFFHVFESLHMLSGRNDARWLDRFVRDFSSRFAEDDGHQHGAYGFRWRRHFDLEGGGASNLPDQLDTVVRLLRENPADRRAVLTMWDPVADLGADKRDVCCNTHAYLRVRRPAPPLVPNIMRSLAEQDNPQPVLDLTVCCRSNDAVWGAYGANAVHFSMLQEYLAGRIGVGIGRYYQVSANYHGYVDVLTKVGDPTPSTGYPGTAPIGRDWSCWDEDLARFMAWTGSGGVEDVEDNFGVPQRYPNNPWFEYTATPLFIAHTFWRMGQRENAFEVLNQSVGMSPDWRQASCEWFERRMKR